MRYDLVFNQNTTVHYTTGSALVSTGAADVTSLCQNSATAPLVSAKRTADIFELI